MKRIGIISDTHGFWDEKLSDFLNDCHEIWHAGDIGNLSTANTIATFKPLRAVHGNIDDSKIRGIYPKILRFNCEDVDVLITHIGGSPGKYDKEILPIIKNQPPALFICGHSHILKVIYDKQFDFLFINPGAAGSSGFHNLRTAIRLTIDGNGFSDMEILEIPRD
jgi:hypothetical protein